MISTLLAIDPATLLAAAVVGLGYGISSDVIGESKLPENSVAGLVFKLGRILGGKIRTLVTGGGAKK